MRFLTNQIAYMTKEEDKNRYRKSLIVMLYSHYEGFSKVAFTIYVGAINQEGLLCSDVVDAIAVASLATAFDSYDDRDKKCQFFKNELPEDGKLHRFARQVDLLSELNNILSRQVNIPADMIVDTEGNLKSYVMRKILFRLGFPHLAFADQENTINMLLQRRNNVAHGADKNGMDEKTYKKLETAVFDMMDDLLKMIVKALRDEIYKKSSFSSALEKR